jgi:1,4-alpha-glucan branching enzyme
MALSSMRPGMGGIPYDGGTTFRVWAPFASEVSVVGSFNDWQPGRDLLARGDNGYWSCDVVGARVGDQYKFVLRNPAINDPFWKNDPYARALTNSVGNSILAETGAIRQDLSYSTPPWNEMVIYELHVGSFRFDPGSSNGRGNFDTVIGQLDYLRDLGINSIQLLPSDEFPGDVSWGYNPAYIFAIESSYGGPNGLRRLVDAAHARGIAIIYDVVYNHFGPDDLDLWQFDGWSQNGQGGIYFYNDWRQQTPLGQNTSGLRSWRGTSVYSRQRSALARGTRVRRIALGCDRLDT